jgi:hypothetical protein
MNPFDCFDDITIEEDPGYAAYQAELEYRQWYEEGGWIEEVNAELAEIAESERENNVSEYSLTNDDLVAMRAFGD